MIIRHSLFGLLSEAKSARLDVQDQREFLARRFGFLPLSTQLQMQTYASRSGGAKPEATGAVGARNAPRLGLVVLQHKRAARRIQLPAIPRGWILGQRDDQLVANG